MAQTPQERYQAASRQALRCRSTTPTTPEASIEVRKRRQEIATSAPTSSESPASTSPSSPTLRNPTNQPWTKATQREAFIQHLRNWAFDHDSSAHFHGSISLYSQGAVSEEAVGLGRSVNCLLFDASSYGPPRKIVIRLYQSRHCRDDAQKFRRKDPARALGDASRSSKVIYKDNDATKLMAQHRLFIPPYQLVVRSGSGWVTARQYFDKQHFMNRAKMAKEAAAQSIASTNTLSAAQQRNAVFVATLVANQTLMHQSTAMPTLTAGLSTNVDNPQIPGWNSLRNINNTAGANSAGSNVNISSSNGVTAPTATAHGQRRQGAASLALSRHAKLSVPGKTIVQIGPLFRSFSRLPQELRDEILYHAIGYTEIISISRAVPSKDAPSLSEPPITISKLFRISKMINEHMIAHIFRRTNFHFGMTGFTNFLWQIGPLNRSNLQNLTFRFGKASLLHCVRWLAPDPIWELFEPPVSTSPPALTYFWRCQLQDLMKELTLLTLTVDIRGVPPADVSMLIRILKTAIGSCEHIRIIEDCGSATETKECTYTLRRHFPDTQELTWREMGLRYHSHYKHLRWHMRRKWTLHGLDATVPLNEWMDQDRAFFDA